MQHSKAMAEKDIGTETNLSHHHRCIELNDICRNNADNATDL